MGSLSRRFSEQIKRRARPAVLAFRQLRSRITLTELGRATALSFSQFGEDFALIHHFGDHIGFYVDVGALHPYYASDTAAMYRRG